MAFKNGVKSIQTAAYGISKRKKNQRFSTLYSKITFSPLMRGWFGAKLFLAAKIFVDIKKYFLDFAQYRGDIWKIFETRSSKLALFFETCGFRNCKIELQTETESMGHFVLETAWTHIQSHYIEVAQGGVSSRAIHNHTQFWP